MGELGGHSLVAQTSFTALLQFHSEVFLGIGEQIQNFKQFISDKFHTEERVVPLQEEEKIELTAASDTSRSRSDDFLEFHRLNPDVYKYLREFALVARHRGRKTSIKCLFERVRWEISIELRDKPFKLNNNYTAAYARMLMQREPLLRGFFTTRTLKVAA